MALTDVYHPWWHRLHTPAHPKTSLLSAAHRESEGSKSPWEDAEAAEQIDNLCKCVMVISFQKSPPYQPKREFPSVP